MKRGVETPDPKAAGSIDRLPAEARDESSQQGGLGLPVTSAGPAGIMILDRDDRSLLRSRRVTQQEAIRRSYSAGNK
jgi:hypothetical protein